MAPVYDAVRAVADCVTGGTCSTRLAAALVAAAVRAAVSASGPGNKADEDPLVSELVEDRLPLLRPVLLAQTQVGLEAGFSPHSGKGLVSDDVQLRANAARHAAFDKQALLSKLASGCRGAEHGPRVLARLRVRAVRVALSMLLAPARTLSRTRA